MAGAFALMAISGATGCSPTAVFDSSLAKDVEAKLEMIVRRGAGNCWTARRGRQGVGPGRPYSPRSLSFGLHEAVGPTFSGCA